MAIVDKYESRNLPNLAYVTFFCDTSPACNSDWVEAVMLMRDDTLPSGETLWCVGNTQVTRDEISKFAVAPETGDEDYSTQGWSVACTSPEEMFDELRSCGFADGYDMEQLARSFFNM